MALPYVHFNHCSWVRAAWEKSVVLGLSLRACHLPVLVVMGYNGWNAIGIYRAYLLLVEAFGPFCPSFSMI